ncbi:MAG: SurA N-terminal domain-containing protein [Candidatus Adiutrix sp.]|nr:SurA N-terminal domain-containing protein [Candidatus Adiutrix sp.]
MKRLNKKSFLSAFMSIALFLAGCREEAWNPEVAVLVNGDPIPVSELDRILEWGFHPPVGADGEPGGVVDIRQILAKLIDEKLILDEAAKVGLTVSPKELKDALGWLETAWFGNPPPPAELAELKETLRRQILLRKMTEKVIEDGRVLSAADWSVFWAAWPKNAVPRYQVRLLFAPPLDEAPEPMAAEKRGGLEQMAEDMKAAGLAVVISEPLRLNGSRLEPRLAEDLAQALTLPAGRRLAGPYRLPESWAMYEILEVDVDRKPGEELLAAKAAFEAMTDENVFKDWLAETRAAADIKISPAFFETQGSRRPEL